MAINKSVVSITLDGYDPETGLIAKSLDKNSPNYNKPIVNKPGDGQAVALGGGVYLTTPHIFDDVIVGKSGQIVRFKATSSTIEFQPITGYFNLRPYDAVAAYQQSSDVSKSWNDLSLVKANVTVTASSLTPLVVFLDQSAVTKFLTDKLITNNGQTRSPSGNFTQSNAYGEFTVNFGTDAGDSGGPASIDLNGKSYAVGVLSRGNAFQSIYSYLDQSAFYSAMDAVESTGYNFAGSTPDLLIGSEQNEYVRGTKRRASIITNGDGNKILAGSAGDIINTGDGNNDEIFLQGGAENSYFTAFKLAA